MNVSYDSRCVNNTFVLNDFKRLMQWAIGDGIRIRCVLIALNCPPGLLLDKQTKGIVPWSEQLNNRSTLNTAMYQVELPGPPLPKKLATVSEYIGNIFA